MALSTLPQNCSISTHSGTKKALHKLNYEGL